MLLDLILEVDPAIGKLTVRVALHCEIFGRVQS